VFRVVTLFRALPSILAELVSLVWYAYRTGDRGMAAAALVWLSTTLVLAALAMSSVMTALRGGEVQLRGVALVAAVPIAMWVARELIGILLALAGRIIALLGPDPLDARL
jgi:hypothetical protein